MRTASLSVNCNCRNEFQDATYGKGIRVATPRVKGTAYCTSCNREHLNFNGTNDNKKGKKAGGGKGGAKSYFAKPPVTGWSGGEPIANGWKPVV